MKHFQAIAAVSEPPRMTAMRRRSWPILLCLGICLLPSAARADAGTPLMWAAMSHLVIGNALIGLFEGSILAKVFALKKGRTIGLLIAANYFSAWMGEWFLDGPVVRSLHMDLNNGWRWFWILAFLTYLMTLVLEWPFVALCFRASPGWFKRSLKGNLIVQTASYFLLFGWYWMASETSLYTRMQVVPAGAIPLPEAVTVYFISDQDGDVYSLKPSSGERHKLFELQSKSKDDRLFVQQSEAVSNCWNLMARLETTNYDTPQIMEIKKCFADQAVLDSAMGKGSDKPESPWFNFGPVPRLGAASKSPWEFYAGFWSGEGLRASNKEKRTEVDFSLETPFAAWIVRNATKLPTDKVIFQLGSDQICIFDPETKKVALLTHGWGPVAGLVEKRSGQ